jgi:tetratricopeptide (TPR) repeat protein
VDSSESLSDKEFIQFAKHARAGTILTVVGGAIVAASLAYSGYQFAILERSKVRQTRELVAFRAEVAKLKTEANAMHAQLDVLERQTRKVRESSSLVQLGLKKFFSRNFEGALPYYDRAIAVDPTNPVWFDLKGYALLRAGRTDEAVQALQRAVTLDPQYIWGHYNLALAYWAAGNKPGAIQEVTRVLAIDPTFRTVIKDDGQFLRFRSSPDFLDVMAGGG